LPLEWALSRAVSCVLDNAVRAAGPGGHVSVEVSGNANEITIQVVDDGPWLGNVPGPDAPADHHPSSRQRLRWRVRVHVRG